MAKEDVKLSVEEMEKVGVNFGHKVSKLHPKMKEYVSGLKNGVHIFDLEKTSKEFSKALAFISKTVADGKSIVFVGTKIQLKCLIKDAAEACGISYVTERWLGGTFTNFETIQKRVSYFKDLEKRVEEIANIYNIKYKIVGRQNVLPYAPRVSKVRLDLKII